MPYDFSTSVLFEVLSRKVPSQLDKLQTISRTNDRGLLSVGFKLHCLSKIDELDQLFWEMQQENTNRHYPNNQNSYKLREAVSCWVFPPMGSAQVVIKLLDAIEHAVGVPLFANPEIQIQVCSPGQLLGADAALLTITKYLASDILNLYNLDDLTHNFSGMTKNAERVNWGRRLTLRDAPNATFDRQFEWWTEKDGDLCVQPLLPLSDKRTDILDASTALDIMNVNLIATLLVHKKYDGYWKKLGHDFTSDINKVLEQHCLSHLLEASWIATGNPKDADDQAYYKALDELMAYAMEEEERLRRPNSVGGGILYEVSSLINFYHEEVTTLSPILNSFESLE